MSTNQPRINPAILNFFLRKRQQQGGWDERLPDNESVGEATTRIAPYIGDEPKTGGWRDFIQNAPTVAAQPTINRGINQMSRAADIPVMDTLQRSYNPETGDMPEMINPMPPPGGSLRETRPRTVTPNIINAAQNYQPDNFQQSVKPLDSKGQDLPVRLTGSPPTPQIIAAAQGAAPPQSDVIARPPATAISKIFDATRADSPPIQSTFDGTQQPRIAAQPATDERGVLIDGAGQPLPLPASMADTSHESRARITDPSQFLINRAVGSLTDQPTYGFDKNGLPRTQAKRGVLGRAGAFGKTIFKDVTEGRPLIGSLLDAGHAAANPDIVEKRRLEEQQQQNFRDAAPALAIQREQAQIADTRAQAAQRIQSPLSRDLQARRAAVLRTVATQKHYKRGENPALDNEIAATGTPIGEFDNRRDPNANKMAIVHEGQTYMVTPKQALDYSMGQDVELSPGNFVRLTPGQQAGYYGQVGRQAQSANEFNVSQARMAQQHNAEERRREAESISQIKEDEEFNANIQKAIEKKQSRVLELQQKAKDTASPKEQTELEKEAERLQESIDEWGTKFRPKRTQYVPNLMDEGSVEVPKAGTVRTPTRATSSAPKSDPAGLY